MFITTAVPKESVSAVQAPLKYELKHAVLPPELIFHIVEYIDPREVSPLRVISRTWNKFVCMSLRRSCHQLVKLRDDAEVGKFLELLGNRVQDDIPFSAFELFPCRAFYLPFVLVIGPNIKTAFMHFQYQFQYQSFESTTPVTSIELLLAETPNLETLTIQNSEGEFINFSNLKLWRLRRFSFLGPMKKFESIETSKLAEWIPSFPALQELVFKIPLKFNSGHEFLKFLGLLQHLRSFHIEIHCFPSIDRISNSRIDETLSLFKGKSVGLGFRPNTSGPTSIDLNWLSHFSPYINSLGYYLEAPFVKIPILPNLDCLGIRVMDTTQLIYDGLEPLQLPVLETVFYNGLGGCRRFPFKSGAVFQSVKTLFLYEVCRLSFPWGETFPNLQSLTLSSCNLTKNGGDLEYIRTWFPNLVHLCMNYTLIDPNFPVCAISITGGFAGQYIWPLAPLEYLKRLEVQAENTAADKVLLGLAYLTNMKKIQPLEYLGVYGADNELSKTVKLLMEEKMWHKKVCFQPKPPASMDWVGISR